MSDKSNRTPGSSAFLFGYLALKVTNFISISRNKVKTIVLFNMSVPYTVDDSIVKKGLSLKEKPKILTYFIPILMLVPYKELLKNFNTHKVRVRL